MSLHRLHHGLSLKTDIRARDAGVVEYDDGAVRESGQLGVDSQKDVDAYRRSPSIRTVSRSKQGGVFAWCLDLIH